MEGIALLIVAAVLSASKSVIMETIPKLLKRYKPQFLRKNSSAIYQAYKTLRTHHTNLTIELQKSEETLRALALEKESFMKIWELQIATTKAEFVKIADKLRYLKHPISK